MNTNNTFSFSRFWNLSKWELSTNRESIVARGLAVFVSLLVLFLIFRVCFGHSYYAEELRPGGELPLFGPVLPTIIMFCVLGLFLFLGAMYATCMTENLRSKSVAISYLMLPATALEKYLVRVLYITVGYVLLFVVSFIIADFISALFGMLLYRSDGFIMVTSLFVRSIESVETFFNVVVYNRMEFDGAIPHSYNGFMTGLIFMSICSLLFQHAIFVLGGVIFNFKHAFLKTILAIIVIRFALSMLFFIFLIITGFQFMNSTQGSPEFATWLMDMSQNWESIYWIITTVFVIAVWFFAYYRIKTAQVAKGGRK